MKAFVTLLMALCLTLGMADAWARESAVAASCGGTCPLPRHPGAGGTHSVPVCPGPATCPLCSLGGAIPLPSPDFLRVRMVSSRRLADAAWRAVRRSYPPPLPPPRARAVGSIFSQFTSLKSQTT
jgi:hypothetical protein